MNFHVVTEPERAMKEGLAPARTAAPTSREDVLLPLTMRERAAVVAMASAIKSIGLTDESPQTVAAWKELLTGFATITGVSWHDAARYW